MKLFIARDKNNRYIEKVFYKTVKYISLLVTSLIKKKNNRRGRVLFNPKKKNMETLHDKDYLSCRAIVPPIQFLIHSLNLTVNLCVLRRDRRRRRIRG